MAAILIPLCLSPLLTSHDGNGILRHGKGQLLQVLVDRLEDLVRLVAREQAEASGGLEGQRGRCLSSWGRLALVDVGGAESTMLLIPSKLTLYTSYHTCNSLGTVFIAVSIRGWSDFAAP